MSFVRIEDGSASDVVVKTFVYDCLYLYLSISMCVYISVCEYVCVRVCMYVYLCLYIYSKIIDVVKNSQSQDRVHIILSLIYCRTSLSITSCVKV